MFYKTEMHCHTSEVSLCAHQDVYSKVDQYIKEGYTTLVLTNHLSDESTGFREKDFEKGSKIFVETYRKMKEYAKDRLNILLGVEVRFWGDMTNDYLTYGISEDFILNHPEIIELYQTKYYNLCHENGYLVIQAHPFRTGMLLPDPKYLDGIEVFNGNKDIESHNDFADMWANEFNFIKTSGSDHHNEKQDITCGIVTEFPITSNEQLVETLKNGNYWLLKSDIPGATRPM